MAGGVNLKDFLLREKTGKKIGQKQAGAGTKSKGGGKGPAKQGPSKGKNGIAKGGGGWTQRE